jgi:predicted ArsR family transcriptional regulator
VREPDETEGFGEQVSRIAGLAEPTRRALYRYVISQLGPVGREQAAAATGIPPHVAKFHLDRLEADGLLEAEYSRPPGRSGPGAGRPAKRYRRSARPLSVSLPERRYDLAGQIMAQAIAAATRSPTSIADELHDAAAGAGRELGQMVTTRLGGCRSPAACRGAVSKVLAEHGYEPHYASGTIILANCPFHALAQRHTELVCGMNLDMIVGMLECSELDGLHAKLDPAPGRCCVTIDEELDR